MRPSFGANLPQIVKYIWQKAFFKHALERTLSDLRFQGNYFGRVFHVK
jgi:hypothetical protein